MSHINTWGKCIPRRSKHMYYPCYFLLVKTNLKCSLSSLQIQSILLILLLESVWRILYFYYHFVIVLHCLNLQKLVINVSLNFHIIYSYFNYFFLSSCTFFSWTTILKVSTIDFWTLVLYGTHLWNYFAGSGITSFLLCFIVYVITVVLNFPTLPPSTQPNPHFHSQSLHCCPCPRILHMYTLTNPFFVQTFWTNTFFEKKE